MPLYQNTSVTSLKLIVGNYKLETSASANGTYVNIGAGMLNAFNHEPTKYDTQAGNAPDPIEGIADEECTVSFDMIEYDASVLAAISTGLLTADTTTSSTQSTLNAGGQTTLTPRAFKFTNTRLVSGATKQTIITVYNATLDTGLVITAKSDNDGDPVNVMPVTIRGKLDSTRTAGSQLFKIVKDVV